MMDNWISQSAQWWTSAVATDAPLLPSLAAQQVWMLGAWAVVLAWVSVALSGRSSLRPAAAWSVAWLVAAWTCVPGAYGPGYWLGLAFQAPSLVTVTWCAMALLQMAGGRPAQQAARPRQHGGWLLWSGIATGWLLLLDTLALLPGVQLYAWGFSPIPPALLLVAVWLPCVLPGVRPPYWIAPVVSTVGWITLPLPLGHLLDAVPDP